MPNYLNKHLPYRIWSEQSRRLFGDEYEEALQKKIESAEKWKDSRDLLEEEEEIFDWLIGVAREGGSDRDLAMDNLLFLGNIVEERIHG